MFRASVADLTGHLTGGGLLARTLALRWALRRAVLRDDEKFVGLLLPPSVGAVVANAAVSLDRRVAVNLNYTLSGGALNAAVAQCGIRHLLTSRKTVQHGNLDPHAKVVFLEDVLEDVAEVATLTDWITSAFQA
jgi:acyl-[acyl-carrier-protein]-phospholipid O-acyltransferase/long-chain-fatty-acid--[acyl-carrier-protein] ligase